MNPFFPCVKFHNVFYLSLFRRGAMCRYIESIRVADGKVFNIEYHNRRMNRTRRELFGTEEEIDLTGIVSFPLPGIYKCRVIYRERIESVSYDIYTKKQPERFIAVRDDNAAYRYKSEEKAEIMSLFGKRGDYDDIIIVKNGQITDTSSANLIFTDGKGWYTPDTYLLEGTTRMRLLEEGKISGRMITLKDIDRYTYFMPINAMVDFDENRKLPVSNIFLEE